MYRALNTLHQLGHGWNLDSYTCDNGPCSPLPLSIKAHPEIAHDSKYALVYKCGLKHCDVLTRYDLS